MSIENIHLETLKNALHEANTEAATLRLMKSRLEDEVKRLQGELAEARSRADREAITVNELNSLLTTLRQELEGARAEVLELNLK